MDLNKFNKDLIDKIQNHKVELDKAQLWKGIEKKRKKKRRLLFLLPVIFLSLVTVFSIYTKLSYNNDVKVVQNESEEQNKGEAISQRDETTVWTDKNAEKADGLTNPILEIKENKTAKDSKTISVKKNEEILLLSTVSNTENAQINNFRTAAKVEEKQWENTTVRNIRTSNSVAHTEEIGVNRRDAIVQEASSGVPVEIKPSKTINLQIPVMQSLTSVKALLTFSDNYNLDPHFALVSENGGGLGNKIHTLSLYGSYGFVSRELTDPAIITELNAQYIASRKNTESVLEELTLGLGYSYSLHKNCYLRTGMEYAQITEQFRYTEASQNTVSRTGTVLQIIGPDPDMVQNIEGTLTGIQNQRDTYTYHNFFRFIDVPIVLGYTQEFGKFQLGVEGGVLVNLELNFNGDMYDTNLELGEGDDYFKNRIGLRYLMAGRLGYDFNEKLSLFTRPSLVLRSQDVQTERNPLAQNYQVLRWYFGLDYSF